ncbi:MAG: hypothetical protein R2880_09045 [Deinococcales bacterium]
MPFEMALSGIFLKVFEHKNTTETPNYVCAYDHNTDLEAQTKHYKSIGMEVCEAYAASGFLRLKFPELAIKDPFRIELEAQWLLALVNEQVYNDYVENTDTVRFETLIASWTIGFP